MRNSECGMRIQFASFLFRIPHSAFRSIPHSALLLTVSDPGLIRCQTWGFLESSNSARDPGHFRAGHGMVFSWGVGNRDAISLLGRLSSGLLSILVGPRVRPPGGQDGGGGGGGWGGTLKTTVDRISCYTRRGWSACSGVSNERSSLVRHNDYLGQALCPIHKENHHVAPAHE